MVVVGGGPVGLVVAAELAGYGVRTLLVEEATDVCQRPKATTLHARTVQCLVRRGHLGGLVAAGKHTGSAPVSTPFHFAGIPGLAISVPPTEPEPVLKCAQEDLERAFERRARVAGVRILRGHRVTEVREESGGAGLRGGGAWLGRSAPRGARRADARDPLRGAARPPRRLHRLGAGSRLTPGRPHGVLRRGRRGDGERVTPNETAGT